MSRKSNYVPQKNNYLDSDRLNGMNFLDAHKRVYDYLFAVQLGAHPDAMGFYNEKNLPANFDKDKLIDAYKLFFAHTFFFAPYSPDEVNQFRFALLPLDLFVCSETYYNIMLCTDYLRNVTPLGKLLGSKYNHMKALESQYSMLFLEKATLRYRMKEFEDFYDFALEESIKYRNIISEALKRDDENQDCIFYDCLREYCTLIYNHLNWEMTPTDLYTFNAFGTMVEYLTNEDSYDIKPYFKGYEHYILTNKTEY